MKPERYLFRRLCLMLATVTLAGFATGQEVESGAEHGKVMKDEGQQNAPASVDAPESEKSVKGTSPADKAVTPGNTNPDAVPASKATGPIDDASEIALNGMIDGDANPAVPVSIIPQVLTDAEREKLGMNQSRFQLPALAAASTALPDGQGDGDRYPETFVEQFGQISEPLPETGDQRSADWHWSLCQWAAANTFSNPRYFEDRMLERHGQHFGCLQPLASGARFFGTVPMLPYLWTVSDPCDCQYTLGYFRPGECVPAMMQRPPYENRGTIIEAGAAAAVIIGFP